MLDIARGKFRREQPGFFGRGDAGGRVRFLEQSVLKGLPPPPSLSSLEHDQQQQQQQQRPAGYYTTVLQTMGLCSTPSPALLLARLGDLAAPGHEGGKVLLLEHGRSHYDWLNRILDRTAGKHAEKHGCWWNRDIGKIVEESGLRVLRVKRYHFGTTWWVELEGRGEGGKGRDGGRGGEGGDRGGGG